MTEIFPLSDVNQMFKVDHRWHNLAAQTDPSALQLHSQLPQSKFYESGPLQSLVTLTVPSYLLTKRGAYASRAKLAL